MFSKLRRARYVLFLSIVPLLLFWRWLLLGEVLYWGTLLLQFWPWHELVKSDLLNGSWPLWNPLLGNGTPLLANQQSAVFYPPNLIYLLMPVEHGLTLSIVLHLMLAGGLMYAYGRHLNLSPFAATVAALSYMLSGYIVGRTQFLVMVNAAAWMPLLLILSDRLARRQQIKDAAWLGLALSLQFLAGHSQLWFYGLILIGAYSILRSQPRTSLRSTARAIVLWAGAVILALLLSAVQVLPTAELVSQSPRGSGIERYEALTYSFWPWRLITLLAPDFFGNPARGNYWGYANYWEDHAYVGVLPFVLALAAIWLYIRRQHRIQITQQTLPSSWQVVPFFAALVFTSVLLALGWNTPVYGWIFENLPGFALFRAPARLLIWYTVAMAVLAGFGAQYLQITAYQRPYWRRLLAATTALAVAGLLATLVLSSREFTFSSATLRVGILLSLAIGLLLIQPGADQKGLLTNSQWQWLAISFVTADLLMAAWPLIPMLSAEIYRSPITSAAQLKSQTSFPRYYADSEFVYQTTFKQYFAFETFGPLEVQYWKTFKETLAPNLGVYANLPSANNNDPLVVHRWRALIQYLDGASPAEQSQLLALMGAQFFINFPVAAGTQLTMTASQNAIHQVEDVLPRVYFVTGVSYAPTEEAALARMAAPDFDYHREIVIIGDGKALDPNPTTGAAIITRAADQRVEIAVRADGPGYVVLLDTFYPGWQATVDGVSSPILPANLAFRAVAVEPGQHQVVLSYQPFSFTIGLWTTLTTGLILGTYLLITWRPKPRR